MSGRWESAEALRIRVLEALRSAEQPQRAADIRQRLGSRDYVGQVGPLPPLTSQVYQHLVALEKLGLVRRSAHSVGGKSVWWECSGSAEVTALRVAGAGATEAVPAESMLDQLLEAAELAEESAQLTYESLAASVRAAELHVRRARLHRARVQAWRDQSRQDKDRTESL